MASTTAPPLGVHGRSCTNQCECGVPTGVGCVGWGPTVAHRACSVCLDGLQWLIKGRVLTGPHPGQLSTAELVKNLTNILSQGVASWRVSCVYAVPSLTDCCSSFFLHDCGTMCIVCVAVRVIGLVVAGITTFVCLQAEMPSPLTSAAHPKIGQHIPVSTVTARPYIEDAQIIVDHGRGRFPQSKPLSFIHLPIPGTHA